ncbi:MAG: carbamoyl-phosphate synthase large subunit [Desulfonauticus sp.]|nr:carbamoyl-phosphate synthase large subunit [Desulfonauticus sp.]
MPKRTDLKKILLIGSGPIVIGQACEFDYSGTQAIKALKEEGYKVVLINSNPATIMTDPELADATYIEPILPEIIAKIIAKETPDALLPTLGGQTGLNVSIALAEQGILDKYGVELIGASLEAIKKAESRDLFKAAMRKIGLKVPKSGIAHSMEEVLELTKTIPFPIIIRPAYTLGGTGGGIAYNLEELKAIAAHGLACSMKQEIMLEESVLGWKEFELEVMRDKKDNCVVICSIENIDPMGIHTGDSITVAPAQTLTDKEYQKMRDAAFAIMREIGVETGGSNVQFAVNPENGDMVVIEMNPRVSRSSALASKATGFPIAKIAAKLAIGYTLDEIPNDITQETVASFEPTIDYCVVKIPRFTFEKFPGTKDELNTSMKSVGETMAIGRTFKEALQKGFRSLEVGLNGYSDHGLECDEEELKIKLRNPHSKRLLYVKQGLKKLSLQTVHKLTQIDPWFLHQIQEIIELEQELKQLNLSTLAKNPAVLTKAKQYGFSDLDLARIYNTTASEIKKIRQQHDLKPTYYLVDSCAAEFEAYTPYFYSTYEPHQEVTPLTGKKVMILGGGPNRIGQGIEFDYCCVHASFALREMGIKSIMVNSNPETVSTDYDTSDRLYFEPLTFEDVLHIVEFEKPDGIIVQFGGQTPLNLALPLLEAGLPILGTSPKSIDRAEDRELFKQMLEKLNLKQPDNGTAFSLDQALQIANQIGYPVVVRPSYVLGGRAMEIVFDDKDLQNYFKQAVWASPDHPVLIDKFLENAIEVDVDALSDGNQTYIGGIMEHIEEAGIHSGDSACVLPPHTLSPEIIEEIKRQTCLLATELKVVGLMNIQFAIKNNEIYILEVNPRASRTIPFVSKATGVPLAKLATKVMLGLTLKDLKSYLTPSTGHFAVKEAVLPFNRFPGVDVLLGPEMRSTGEVMGIDQQPALSYLKAQMAAGQNLPLKGNIFVSVKDKDKPLCVDIIKIFYKLGFNIIATRGTGQFLQQHDIPVQIVNKVYEGRPNAIDYIKNGHINLLINTSSGKKTIQDSSSLRQTALLYEIPYATTLTAAKAMAFAIQEQLNHQIRIQSLQEYYHKG